MSKRFLKHVAIVSGLSVLLFGMASALALEQSQKSPRLNPRVCELREEVTNTERSCHADRFADVVAGNPAGLQSDGPAQGGAASSGAGPSGADQGNASASDASTGGVASGDSGGTVSSGAGNGKAGKHADNGGGNGGGDGSPNGHNDADR